MTTMSGYRYAAPLSLRPNRDGTKYGVPGIAFPICRVTIDNPVLDEQRGWTRQECLDRLDSLRITEKELAGFLSVRLFEQRSIA
jgi:hypothetical protein